MGVSAEGTVRPCGSNANGMSIAAARKIDFKFFYCRLYLQAETASDLATVSGKMLDQPSKLRGEWSMQTSQSHGNFIIYQEKTAGNAWTLWQKANKLWSHLKLKLS